MVGIFFQVSLAGLLAAAPSGGFTFEGAQASARTTSSTGYFAQGTTPYPNIYERGLGSATLTAEDRVPAWGATYGDQGRVEAEFQLGQVKYRVELTQVGFPPEQASGTAGRSAAPRPSFPVAGGVMLHHALNGASGQGWTATTQAHAAVVVWGVGSVWRDGKLLTDSALIQAAALSQGTHADDETHRILSSARSGDAELEVLVWNLPVSAEPRGFLQFSFDDVAIELAGRPVNAVAVVPNVGGGESSGARMSTGGTGGDAAEGVGGSGSQTTAQPEAGTPGSPVTPVQSEGPPGQTPPSLPNVGTFTVPLSPPSFNNFAGTGQVSPGILATSPPLSSDPTVPTPPPVGAPAPLNASSGTPLPGTPAPLTSSPPPALITTPTPGNVPSGPPATPVAPIPGIPATGAPPSVPGSTGAPPSP